MVGRYLRGFSALSLAGLITVTLGLFGSLAVLPLGFLSYFVGCVNPAKRVLSLWAFLIEEICAKRILGMHVGTHVIGSKELGYEEKLKPLEDDEIAICFGNHPSTLLMPSFINFVSRHISKNIVALGKKEHLRNPFFGAFVKWSGTCLFVDQNSNEETSIAIKRDLYSLIKTPMAIIIFPDSHRPNKELIGADIRHFSLKISDLPEWLLYTLVPRSGAMFTLLNELRGRKLRFIDLTTICSKEDDSIFKTSGLVGASVTIQAREVSDIPQENRQALNSWLNADWKKKNFCIFIAREWVDI